MKTNYNNTLHNTSKKLGVFLGMALVLCIVNLRATTLTTLGGGNPNVNPKYQGYKDGGTLTNALFHTPMGVALDESFGYLYVADRDNNAVRIVDLLLNDTETFAPTNMTKNPVAVAVDGSGDVFVLNRGGTNNASTNGYILEFDTYGDFIGTNATKLTNAAGMAIDLLGNLYVTSRSNMVSRIAPNGTVTVIAIIPNAGTSLQGLAVKHNGLLAVCDSGRNGIYLIDPATGIVTTNSGFNGAGDGTGINNHGVLAANAKFNQPMGITEAGDGSLIITDTGNNRTKVINIAGVVTNLAGVSSNFWSGAFPGWFDGTVIVPDRVTPNAQSRLPVGIVFSSSGTIYITEDYYHTIRKITGAGLASALAQVSNPTVSGNNAADFFVNNTSTNALMYYTLDGTDPVNGSPSIGPITNGTELFLNITTNTTFKVRAFLPGNFQPSSVVTVLFTAANFSPVSISFGFATGEASSDFVGSPGQTFIAPITLGILPGTIMYSLQFNLTVTNNVFSPPIIPGTFAFQSMLMKPAPPDTNAPGVTLYEAIPPFMFIGDSINPPPPGQIVGYNGTNFINLQFTNLSLNLLGVGWSERAGAGKTNLFDTKSQNLLTYSLAHDDLFPNLQQPHGVVVGSYSVQVPANAVSGNSYQIEISRPSATSDGVGAPGSAVYIATPTNGSLTAGAINAVKTITVGQRKYVAGDVYPFRWFNAGDFGKGYLNNADVQQVFQTAIYRLNGPPPGSDFFDAMDSCGYTYVDNGNGYLEKNTLANTSVLFSGNDSSINQIAFGDNQLDVCDVYVTFRRSLDPSLTWFRRYWTNGVRVAESVPNVVPRALKKSLASQAQSVSPASTNAPQVTFNVSNFVATAGQTIQIPITAQIFGAYPLKVLLLGLSVVPLDGSPALTTSVSFTPATALGTPAITESSSFGNYAATWLNTGIAGLTGNTVVGTLTVTIPANASANSAYAVHFDHGSASPNGLVSFAKQIIPGLITLSARTNSSYGDGIPDSWRLRWFGTINNSLTVSNADACGDGINNWQKYIAGVDPTQPNSYPKLKSKSAPAGSTAAIHWPTVLGKKYAIERASNLFGNGWTAISTNTGTGTDMEFDDTNSGQVKFYRVRILP